MLSNIYTSHHILSTKHCFVCQKAFSFGELILRYSSKDTTKFIYYHPTCLACIKCKRKFSKDDKNFFNMIYYFGNFRIDQVLCDQCKIDSIHSDHSTDNRLPLENFRTEEMDKTSSQLLYVYLLWKNDFSMEFLIIF